MPGTGAGDSPPATAGVMLGIMDEPHMHHEHEPQSLNKAVNAAFVEILHQLEDLRRRVARGENRGSVDRPPLCDPGVDPEWRP
jgi:hypothetical protein